MKRNRAKFLGIVERVKDLKRCYRAEIEAATRGATDAEARRVPRVAVVAVQEGAWVCDVAARKAASNHHKLSKDDQSALEKAKAYFQGVLAENEDAVYSGGFLPHLDAVVVTHLEAVCGLVLKMDAEEAARKAKAIAAQGLSVEDDEESEVDDAADAAV